MQKVEKIFYVLDHCIWIGCGKLSLLWKEYLHSAVNTLANSPKISTMTKKDIFQLYFSKSNQIKW